MWIQHLFSLFGTIAASFVNDIGTTWLGLVLSLVFGLATTVFRVFREHGAEALRKHLRENARVAVRYTFLCAAVLYGSIAIWEAGKAVYLDHEVLVARSQSQRRTIAQNDAKRSEATNEINRQLVACGIDKSRLEGASGTLSAQNRDQQNTINNCQTQALKLLTPPQQQTQVRLIWAGPDESGPNRTYEVLLLTNKPVFPASVRVFCQRKILSIEESLLFGGGRGPAFAAPPRKVSDSEYTLTIMSPPWSPDAPFLIKLTNEGQGISNDCPCTFERLNQ